MLLLATLSGALQAAVTVELRHPHDFILHAKATGNPFDVPVAAEVSGPNAMRMRIPGFYDGDGIWKVRFSPAATGNWTLRTVSPVAELNGRVEESLAVANRNPNIHGALQIDPTHPFHFRFQDGTRFFLMGYEADWLWGADMLDPSRKLMRRLIDQISARGFNYVLVNVYAHDTRWCPGKVNEWDFGPPALYAWEGSNEQPDHSRLNPRFFKIYDGMMQALLEKGVIAHIMLKVYNKQVNWPARGSRDEERYFRYLAARYQAFPNLVWDFSKESYNERDNLLQKHLLDLVRSEDAYHHLVTAHDDDAYEWDPALNRNLDFRIDQQHSDWAEMVAFDRAFRARPVVNAEFSYELGVEKLPTHTNRNQVDWPLMLHRAYLIYMAGGYAAYYYNNTAWDIVKPDPEPPGQARWQLLKETFTSIPYWRMLPCNEMAVGGPALCDGGSTRVFYAHGARITVNLNDMETDVSARWVDTWTGAQQDAGGMPQQVMTLQKPSGFGQAPALLIIRRKI